MQFFFFSQSTITCFRNMGESSSFGKSILKAAIFLVLSTNPHQYHIKTGSNPRSHLQTIHESKYKTQKKRTRSRRFRFRNHSIVSKSHQCPRNRTSDWNRKGFSSISNFRLMEEKGKGNPRDELYKKNGDYRDFCERERDEYCLFLFMFCLCCFSI